MKKKLDFWTVGAILSMIFTIIATYLMFFTEVKVDLFPRCLAFAGVIIIFGNRIFALLKN